MFDKSLLQSAHQFADHRLLPRLEIPGRDVLAAQIASLHNIAFYLRLVTMARQHIATGDFKPWKEAMVGKLQRRL